MKAITALLFFLVSQALGGLLDPQEESLELSRIAIDGGWTEWTAWTKCTRSCGRGTQSHSRLCINPRPSGGGITCLGERQKTILCNLDPCPIGGKWGSWGDYSDCSVTCGNGFQTRYRYCDNPVPQYNGPYCIGSNSSRVRCTNARCYGAVKPSITKPRRVNYDWQQAAESLKMSDRESDNFIENDKGNDENIDNIEEISNFAKIDNYETINNNQDLLTQSKLHIK